MADRLYTTSESDEILSALRFETKLEKVVLARIAFALSLKEAGADVDHSLRFDGSEMKRPTFIGDDETFLRTLIPHVYQKPDISEEELYSNKSIIKNHIDHGCQCLQDLFMECGRDSDQLLSKLTNLVEFSGRKELKGRGLKILTDIRLQSNFQTNFIYFDYKGDVVENERFIETAKVQPYQLLHGGTSLPVNPFILPAYDEQSINVSAREKSESFASINSRLGVVQKGTLTEAIKAAYAKRRDASAPYPDFQDVLEIASAMYEEDHKKDDSLIEVLKDLADFDLFWKHGDENQPIKRLTNRTLLIDVHTMPVLKELVAYLVIERIYKEMASLPDSPVKEGQRTIRTILVIDEAHNYLNQKNMFLQRIIREGRSKGIVVFFASQSPNDYQQKFFNFQELLEFAFIFQCEGVSAKSIQDILGCGNKPAKELQTEIARLEPWQVISRSDIKTEAFTKFTAEAFYKNY